MVLIYKSNDWLRESVVENFTSLCTILAKGKQKESVRSILESIMVDLLEINSESTSTSTIFKDLSSLNLYLLTLQTNEEYGIGVDNLFDFDLSNSDNKVKVK